jgi:hypothetical protein
MSEIEWLRGVRDCAQRTRARIGFQNSKACRCGGDGSRLFLRRVARAANGERTSGVFTPLAVLLAEHPAYGPWEQATLTIVIR